MIPGQAPFIALIRFWRKLFIHEINQMRLPLTEVFTTVGNSGRNHDQARIAVTYNNAHQGTVGRRVLSTIRHHQQNLIACGPKPTPLFRVRENALLASLQVTEFTCAILKSNLVQHHLPFSQFCKKATVIIESAQINQIDSLDRRFPGIILEVNCRLDF
jgi:hypothetical protein